MLLQQLDKLKRSSIMTSIILMAVGLGMIICPEKYISVAVSALGYGMIVFAIVLVLDFMSSRKVLINYISFTMALVIAVLGGSILVFRNHMVQLVALAFGLSQIISGVAELVNALTYARRSGRKGWWILVALAILSIVFGLIVLIHPWWHSTAALFDIIGVMLLFSSLVGIVRLIFIWPIRSEKE